MATLFGVVLLLALVLMFGLQLWSEGIHNHNARTPVMHQTYTSDEDYLP